MTLLPNQHLKLVRILYTNGDTYSGNFTSIQVIGEDLILAGPGRLVRFHTRNIRRVFVGRV